MPRKKSGTFDQGKYIQQYIHDNIKHIKVSLNKNKPEDMQMIAWISQQHEGASGYIKRLIRDDMGKKPLMVCDMCSEYNHTTHECDNMDSPFWHCPTLESDYCSCFHCEIETK